MVFAAVDFALVFVAFFSVDEGIVDAAAVEAAAELVAAADLFSSGSALLLRPIRSLFPRTSARYTSARYSLANHTAPIVASAFEQPPPM